MNFRCFSSIKTLLIISLGLGLLQGCASMSADECLTADWYMIGYEDGVRGRSTGNITHRRKACAKHGVTPDLNQYTSGHAKGVVLYCVARKGFEVGSRGGVYPSLCPAQQYSEFDQAYQQGRRVHTAQVKINQLQSEYDAVYRELSDLRFRIELNEDQIIADGTEPHTRRDLMTQNKELNLIANGLEVDLSEWKQDVEAAKRRRDLIRY